MGKHVASLPNHRHETEANTVGLDYRPRHRKPVDRISHLSMFETINRKTQKTDVIYVFEDGSCMTTPDGEGRYWFDDLAHAKSEVGLEDGDHIIHARSDQLSDDWY